MAEAAQSFRRELGFRNDWNFVVGLQHRADLAASEDKFGIPLTPTEQREMRLRLAAGTAIPALSALLARTAPHQFAGVYLDHLGGGIVVVRLVHPAARLVHVVDTHFPYPARLRIVSAKYSDIALRKLQARVFADASYWKSRGLRLASVAVDPHRDQVAVAVSPASARRSAYDDVGALAAYYRARSELQVTIQEAPRTVDCSQTCDVDPPPWKAGQEIYHDLGNGYATLCTAGFGVHSYSISGTIYYQLTAGHCGGNGLEWDHYIYALGKSLQQHLGGNNDSELVRIAPTKKSNLIFTAPSTYVTVTSMQSDTSDYNGEPYCFFGRTTGVKKCGTIVNQNSNVIVYDDNGNVVEKLTDVVETSIPYRPGDSGGPNFYGHQAMGITTADNNTNGWYSQIALVVQQQGVTINTS